MPSSAADPRTASLIEALLDRERLRQQRVARTGAQLLDDVLVEPSTAEQLAGGT